jgi:hypothetical protein
LASRMHHREWHLCRAPCILDCMLPSGRRHREWRLCRAPSLGCALSSRRHHCGLHVALSQAYREWRLCRASCIVGCTLPSRRHHHRGLHDCPLTGIIMDCIVDCTIALSQAPSWTASWAARFPSCRRHRGLHRGLHKCPLALMHLSPVQLQSQSQHIFPAR